MRDVASEKMTALMMAVELHKNVYASRGDDADVLTTANNLFGYLGGPLVITLIIGPILDQATGRPTGNITKGSPVQLHDDEKVTFTVAESDAKGANVPDDATTTADDVSWTLDNAGVGTLVVSPDTRSCELSAGTVGSGVLTVATGAVALTVTAGDVSKQ
jgi:hypothetical protein